MKQIASFPPEHALLTLHEAQPGVYVLVMHHGIDNRFNHDFCNALSSALAHAEQFVPAVLITTGQGKFFSNGLALEQVISDFPNFMLNHFNQVLLRWLTSPLVTIAAINGHAFAGGMIFSMANDYRIMRNDRGFMCMNEVDIPAPLPPSMCAVVRMRFSNMQAFRDCILEARKFNAVEGAALGLVDKAVPQDQVLAAAVEMGVKLQDKSSLVYGQLKEEMYHEAIHAIRHGGLGLTAVFASKL